MEKEQILQELYRKYIAPTCRRREHLIGVEIEMPVVNLAKEAVDFSVVHALTAAFCERFGFRTIGVDDDGCVNAAQNPENGDILSYDCSYNNLELSFGAERSLNEIHGRFVEYYTFIEAFLGHSNYTLTGMGVNPYRQYNRNVPIPNGRYRMLFHHLHSYRNYPGLLDFHPYPAFGTFASASQVQLDVDFERLPQTLNVMERLEPLKALLFSNSVLPEYDPDLLCCRDLFWEKSTHGLNPRNIGMYGREFHTADEVLDYIAGTSIYCVERGDRYINFPPMVITDYLQSDAVEGEYFDGTGYRSVTVRPKPEDLAYLRTFKFEDLTFRGTIEFRSSCNQPIGEALTIAAFHLGLMERVDELQAILDADRAVYNRGLSPARLRQLFVRRNLPECLDEDAVYALLGKVTDLAREGLVSRKYGEERFLEPLYGRILNHTNPARTMMDALENGAPIEEFITEYAKIS